MMTEQDREALKELAATVLRFKFPHPVNTPEAGKILHDVSALLRK